MAEKTETRLALEARAQALELNFPANIGDAKLEQRVMEAEEAAGKSAQPSATGASNPDGSKDPEGGAGGDSQEAGSTVQPIVDPELVKYEVLDHLTHDGTSFEPGGDPVALTTTQAAHLQARGVVGEPADTE